MVDSILRLWRTMARIHQQAIDAARIQPGDRLDVERLEGLAEVRSLAEDREPAQTRLETFEADLLKQTARHPRPDGPTRRRDTSGTNHRPHTISTYKAPDLVGHKWNMLSPERRSATDNTDAQLPRLIRFLDEVVGKKRLGAGNYG